MAQLISPGVSVTIIDESFYIPGRAATVPLIFIATADEKVQPDGLSPAEGTFEHGVLRTVTTIRQSLELYGVPTYYDTDGVQHHGDVRNEYGLDALNKFLEIGNRAYVIRANVNLNDNLADLKTLWMNKISDAADFLNERVAEYIVAYNTENGLIPVDAGYKESVTATELKTLVEDVLFDVFRCYNFSSDLFRYNFQYDHGIAQAGYQDVIFETGGGFLQLTDVTGLDADTDYSAVIEITHTDYLDADMDLDTTEATTTTFNVVLNGGDIGSFQDLVDALNTEFGSGGAATVTLLNGRLTITSSYEGVTSSVEITDDGPTGYEPLFASLNLYRTLGDPIPGVGISTLPIYNDTYTTVTGAYYGLDSIIDNWTSGSVTATEFTADEAEGVLLTAAAAFDDTQEFIDNTALGSNDAARRLEVVRQMQAEINNPYNGARYEHLEYNVLAAPGFPECSDELIRLSQDMLEEVFVLGETPFNKPPTGPLGITQWATSPARSTSYHISYHYGHGISSNIDGNDILTTASATALRVFAYNDEQQDVWWAPAGTNRGTCPHLVNTGYVSGTLGGPTTFVEEFLDNGTRDELYEFPKNINPITFIPGRGILVLGQKTTSPNISALDRINVSRLVKFIKRQLRKALFSFLFEPNDRITRDNVKFAVDSFLADLIDRRALYDFASICDETNNTPVRIDRNELWIDVAIKPVKAVEFIYAPVRVVNTGADIGGRNILVGA